MTTSQESISMEDLASVVRLIVEMESVTNTDISISQTLKQKKKGPKGPNGIKTIIATSDDEKKDNNNSDKDLLNFEETCNNKEYIRQWIAKRRKRDILFLLASISGNITRVYDKNGMSSKICKLTMDGKYLMLGHEIIPLTKTTDFALGIDWDSKDVKYIMSQMGYKKRDVVPKKKKKLNSEYIVDDANNLGELNDDMMDGDGNGNNNNNNRRDNNDGLSAFFKNNNNNNNSNDIDSVSLKKFEPNHCITVYDSKHKKTTIIQYSNVELKQMWIRGLCHLKNSKIKNKNIRWAVVMYLIKKYSTVLNEYVLKSSKKIPLTKLNKKLNTNNDSNNNTHSNVKNGKKYHAFKSDQTNSCAIEPFIQLMKLLSNKDNGNETKIPKKFEDAFQRRKGRSHPSFNKGVVNLNNRLSSDDEK